jgi:hypothetical protein
MKTFLEMRESLERQRDSRGNRLREEQRGLVALLDGRLADILATASKSTTPVSGVEVTFHDAVTSYVTGPRYVYLSESIEAAFKLVASRLAAEGFRAHAFESNGVWRLTVSWS